MKKFVKYSFPIFLLSSLMGCGSHKNPLVGLNQDEDKDAGKFLVYASVYGEKKIAYQSSRKKGALYKACILKREKKELCNELYKAMTEFPESEKQKDSPFNPINDKTKEDFQGLTVADLKNELVWKDVEPYYKESLAHFSNEEKEREWRKSFNERNKK